MTVFLISTLIIMLLVILVVLFKLWRYHRQIKTITTYAQHIAAGNFHAEDYLKLAFEDTINEKNDIAALQNSFLKLVNRLYESLDKEEMRSEERSRELVLMTRDAEEAKKRAEQAEEAKKLFLANITQEISAPTNTVIEMTELLLAENPGEKRRTWIKAIHTQANTILELFDGIQILSKFQEGTLAINPRHYSYEVFMKSIETKAKILTQEKDLDFKMKIDGESPACLYGDDFQLKQALINILENAVKTTDRGYVNLTVKIDEENITYSITDTGMGIRKDEIPALFNAFRQTIGRTDAKKNQSKQGKGLNLAIAHSLIELASGKITVESMYGQGATFHVVIPKAPGDINLIEHSAEEALGDSQEEFWKSIGRIKGLSLETGLDRIYGQKDVYQKTLKLTIKEIEKCDRNLREFLAAKDMANFRIEVHGIKGSLANIGVMELSAKAYELEKASSGEDLAFCTANTPPFLETLRILGSELKEAFAKDEDPKGNIEIPPELPPILEKLINALEQSDFLATDEAIERLGKIKAEAALKNEIDKIKEAVMMMDNESAIKSANDLLGKA